MNLFYQSKSPIKGGIVFNVFIYLIMALLVLHTFDTYSDLYSIEQHKRLFLLTHETEHRTQQMLN